MALTFTCNVRSNTSTTLDVEHFSTLVVYDFGVSGQFGSKDHTQKTGKIYQDFWIIQSFHTQFSVLKCLNNPKSYTTEA